MISVPAEVSLRKVDLAVELQILSYYQQRRHVEPTPRSPSEPVAAGTSGATAPVEGEATG